MIIKTLKAHNFMRYPEIDINNLPQKGLTGIFGNNEAGKSTLGHLISFALFGVTSKATRGEREQIINWNARNCDAELIFSWEGRDYKVYRKIRRSGSSEVLFEDINKGEAIAKGTRDVNKAILELLAFDFKSFRYSTYVAQKELTLIQDSTKKQDRRAVINNMLGIDVLEKTRKNFPSKIKTLEKDFESVERELNNVMERIEELEQKKADFNKAVGEHKRIQDELAKKEKNLKEVGQKLKEFQQYKELSSRIKSKQEILTGIEKNISTTEKNIQEIEQAKKDLEKFEEQLNDFKDVAEELNKIKIVKRRFDEFLDRLERVKQIVAEKAKHAAVELSKARKEKENLEEKKDSIAKCIEELESIKIDETKIKGLEDSYKKTDRDFKLVSAIASILFIAFVFMVAKGVLFWFVPLIVALILGIVAYTQKKKVSNIQEQLNLHRRESLKLEEKKSELKKNRQEEKQVGEQLDKLVPKIERYSKLSEALQTVVFNLFSDLKANYELLSKNSYDELLELKGELGKISSGDYPFINSKLEIKQYGKKLEQNLDNLTSKAKKKAQLDTEVKNIKQIIVKETKAKESKKQLLDEKQETQEDIERLKQNLPDIEYTPEKHSELEEKISQLEKSINQLNEEKGGEGGVSKTLERDIKLIPELEKKWEELEPALSSKKREIEIYNILNTAFQKTQENIRKNLSPKIESYFSWMLPKITNDRYKKVTVSEDFDIKAFSMEKNDYVDLSVLSGGTEDQLLISLRLAFAKALTPEESQLFLFLDEPISSFDDNRRTSFLEFLRLLEASFHQIFLITHLTGLEDYVDNFVKISESVEGVPIVDYSWGR